MSLQNKIDELEKTVIRHEGLIEAIRDKLDAIRDSLGRVEAQLTGRKEPGNSEFCKQHMGMLSGFCERCRDIEVIVGRLDKDLAGFKIRVATWVSVIVVVVNFVVPVLLKKMGVL